MVTIATIICFILALRSTVEESLTSEFNPPLTITSRSIRPASCVALLVSSASLNTWFIARSTHPKKVCLLVSPFSVCPNYVFYHLFIPSI